MKYSLIKLPHIIKEPPSYFVNIDSIEVLSYNNFNYLIVGDGEYGENVTDMSKLLDKSDNTRTVIVRSIPEYINDELNYHNVVLYQSEWFDSIDALFQSSALLSIPMTSPLFDWLNKHTDLRKIDSTVAYNLLSRIYVKYSVEEYRDLLISIRGVEEYACAFAKKYTWRYGKRIHSLEKAVLNHPEYAYEYCLYTQCRISQQFNDCIVNHYGKDSVQYQKYIYYS